MSPVAYLWITVGSALGGVARAWITVAVARITGPMPPRVGSGGIRRSGRLQSIQRLAQTIYLRLGHHNIFRRDNRT